MILGLTGGIGCGKTTVGNLLKKYGGEIIDADQISKEVARDPRILDEIEKVFGKKVIREDRDRSLDRDEIKKIVFNNREKLLELNNIMHPEIIRRIKKEIERNRKKKFIVLDVPLLYEVGMEKLCDKVLVVWLEEELQLERIVKRDKISRELGLKIIKSQGSLMEKIKKSDFNIENNETIEKLEEGVRKVVAHILS